MLQDALAAFKSEIEPLEVGVALFQFVHDAQGLQVVLETTVLTHAGVERVLTCVSEGSVA